MTIAVIVSPEAEAQIKEVDGWWREKRKAAPDLFLQELAEATGALETMPSAGHRVQHAEAKGCGASSYAQLGTTCIRCQRGNRADPRGLEFGARGRTGSQEASALRAH